MPVTKLQLAASLLCIAATGCTRGSGSHVISVIPREVGSTWTSEHAGVAEESTRQHLAIYWNGPSYADDVEEQIALAERAIERKSYGLIMSPNNPYALNAEINQALAKKIPVVILGAQIPLKPRPGLSFVLSDFEQASDQTAIYLAQRLKAPAEVMIVGINPLSPGNLERAEAFTEALKRRAPELRVVEKQSSAFSFGQTELSTERAIQAHPDLQAIFSLDPEATSGVIAAAIGTGMQKRLHIIGCDQNLNLLYRIRHGELDGLLVQDTRRMGQDAIRQIVAQRRGEAVPETTLVPSQLVTAANIDDDSVQQMLNMDWRTPR